jgi:fibronectin type 3 domain-containing protein
MKVLSITAVFITCISVTVVAQHMPGIRLLAIAKKDTILLRWAPASPVAWQYLNKHGYTVERFTITRNNTLLPAPEKKLLTVQPLKPASLAQWQSEAAVNDYAAVAAEAIYGNDFNVTMPSKSALDVVNKVQELEQRYSFALLAADHSFRAAKLSGLAFADTQVKQNERYLYRVLAFSPDQRIKTDTAVFYIGVQDTTAMPPPSGLHAEFKDRVVKLTWPKELLHNGYISFVIERADEQNKKFTRVNKGAFINFNNPDEKNYQFADSLPANGVRYVFRVRGITPFGEVSDPSEEISGSGYKSIKATVSIREVQEISPGNVRVQWLITGDAAAVKSVYLQRAMRADGRYVNVNKEKLLPGKNEYTDKTAASTNYYRVKLLSDRDSVFSFPHLAQLLDSIPPLSPVALKGSIDTVGITTLSWTPNQEQDLLGYRVYRSHFLNAEFSQITKEPVEEAGFIDTLNLRSMTKSVFYKIVAVDRRFNPSAYSQVLQLEKPDRMPPAPPVIHSVVKQPGYVSIAWIPSPSDDVMAYILLRKSKIDSVWTQVKKVVKDSTQYNDAAVNKAGDYDYAVKAVDNAGNTSPLSPIFSVHVVAQKKLPVNDFTYSVNRQEKTIVLKWKSSEEGIVKYLVYRAEGDAPLSLYTAIDAPGETFTDAKLVVNNTYRYRCKIIYQDGSESPFSNELKVKF